MNVTIDVSEDLESYKVELEATLQKIEFELKQISQTDSVPKTRFNQIDIDIRSAETNVSRPHF